MKKSFQIAGAFVGLIVGAGFASGQEILQFFTSFGWIGVIGSLVATFLFAFLGMQLTQLGSRMQTTSHKDVINYVCGRYLGIAVDIIITFFLFGVAVVMIAGSGSIFEQQFGVPAIVGSIVMTLLTIFTLIMNVEKIVALISSVTPFLLAMVVILTIYAFTTMDLSFAEIDLAAKSLQPAASNWILGGLLYVSYNIAAGAAMLIIIGGTTKDSKVAGMGGFLGGIGLGVLIILINLGMLIRIDSIAGVDMPTLFIANEISPVLGTIMSVILLGMIYNTAVGMLYAFTVRFVKPTHRFFKPSVSGFGVLAFGVSFVGFIKLVSTVYPLMGYLGFTLIIAIAVAWLRIRKNPSAPINVNKEF